MKTILKRELYLIFSLCTIAILSASESTEDRVLLFSHMRRSGITFEWWLPASRARNLPKWQAEEKEHPPLAMTDAVRIARNKGQKGEKLVSVAVQSIPGAEYAPPFNTVFYYKVTFQVDSFDRRVCAVLMDGSVLEPIKTALKPEEQLP